MARKGKTTEEIIGFLREAEVRISQGAPVGKIYRSIGVSEQSYYLGLQVDNGRAVTGNIERSAGSHTKGPGCHCCRIDYPGMGSHPQVIAP